MVSVSFYYPKPIDASYLYQVEHEHDGQPVDDPAYWNSGACSAMAIALYRKTGLPIYAELDPDGDLGHAYVRTPDGESVDARGVFEQASLDQIRAQFLPGCALVPMTPDKLAELHASTCDAWNVYEPEQYIDRHPELFGHLVRGRRRRR